MEDERTSARNVSARLLEAIFVRILDLAMFIVYMRKPGLSLTTSKSSTQKNRFSRYASQQQQHSGIKKGIQEIKTKKNKNCPNPG